MSDLIPEWQTSFSRGMNDAKAATEFASDEAALLLNHWVTPDGQAEVRGGSRRTHTSALNSGAQGYGGTTFRTAAGVTQWVAAVGDKMYYSTDEGASWTELATGLTQAYWSFATMQVGGTNYLYCANGSTTMYRWSGSAWTTVTGPTTGCKYIAVHQERLWATNGVNVYGSKVGDPATWASPDGVAVPVNTHDGDTEVTGLYSVGYLLLIFKRKSVGYLEGNGNSDVIVAAGARGISRDVGCIGHRTIVGVGGNGVMWLSERGFEFYAPGGAPTLVSDSVANFMADINWSEIEANPGLPCAYFYPRRLAYVCQLPGAAAQNDCGFVYRLPVGERPGAASLRDSASTTGQTVSVVDGFLQIGGGSRLRTEGGFLAVATGSQPGIYADVSSGFLSLATNNTTAAATFPADKGTDTSVPISVGYDGRVRQMDAGTTDDALSDGSGGVEVADRLIPRPFIYRTTKRKRGRVARFKATAQRDVTPTLTLIAGGVRGTAHSTSVAAAVDDTPREVRVRVNGRGDPLKVEITGAGAGTKISAVGLAAEILEERP